MPASACARLGLSACGRAAKMKEITYTMFQYREVAVVGSGSGRSEQMLGTPAHECHFSGSLMTAEDTLYGWVICLNIVMGNSSIFVKASGLCPAAGSAVGIAITRSISKALAAPDEG